jgi:hypothetical protein
MDMQKTILRHTWTNKPDFSWRLVCKAWNDYYKSEEYQTMALNRRAAFWDNFFCSFVGDVAQYNRLKEESAKGKWHELRVYAGDKTLTTEKFIALFGKLVEEGNYYMLRSFNFDPLPVLLVTSFSTSVRHEDWGQAIVRKAVDIYVKNPSKVREKIMYYILQGGTGKQFRLSTVLRARRTGERVFTSYLFDHICDVKYTEKIDLKFTQAKYVLCENYQEKENYVYPKDNDYNPTVFLSREIFHIHLLKSFQNDNLEYFHSLLQAVRVKAKNQSMVLRNNTTIGYTLNDRLQLLTHAFIDTPVIPIYILQTLITGSLSGQYIYTTIYSHKKVVVPFSFQDFCELLRVLVSRADTCRFTGVDVEKLFTIVSPGIYARIDVTDPLSVDIMAKCVEYFHSQQKYEIKWWFCNKWLTALPFNNAEQVIRAFVNHPFMQDDDPDIPFLDVLPNVFEQADEKTAMDLYFCREKVKTLKKLLIMKRYVYKL